jgi:hypothetical protein
MMIVRDSKTSKILLFSETCNSTPKKRPETNKDRNKKDHYHVPIAIEFHLSSPFHPDLNLISLKSHPNG